MSIPQQSSRLKPTSTVIHWYRQALASPNLHRLWHGSWLVGAVGIAAVLLCLQEAPLPTLTGGPWGLAIIVGLSSGALGWILSFPVGWLLLGPIFHSQGIHNGGPFQPGDRVLILGGPHKEQTALVYGTWQHGQVRVDLGPEAKASYKDVFAPYELLRLTPRLTTQPHGVSSQANELALAMPPQQTPEQAPPPVAATASKA